MSKVTNESAIARNKSLAGRSKSKLTVNSFFAGIGGFELGFQRAGIRPIYHCEIQPYCNSVLQRHWPNSPCAHDILKVDIDSIPSADVWCGGFPCQDVSVARGWLGRDGLKGKNTGLFYPFAELVKAKLPPVVIMENVAGLLNSHNGRDFAVILQSFQELGYGVSWRVLNTRYYGAPQSRPRVYICAFRNSARRAFDILFESGATHHPGNQRNGFLSKNTCQKTGAHVPEVAFCLAATSGRHTGTDWSRSYVSYHSEVRRLTPTECERLQGFPEGWTLPNEDFHLSDNAIDALRYHAIGNAVSVPVVEWVAKRVCAQLRASASLPVINLNEIADIEYAISRVPDFGLKKAVHVQISTFVGRDDAPKIKWSSGGIMVAGRCVMAPVSSSPSKPVKSLFLNALDSLKPPARYFLSANAATGILRRVTSQNRQLFTPLDAALRRLSKTENSTAPN